MNKNPNIMFPKHKNKELVYFPIFIALIALTMISKNELVKQFYSSIIILNLGLLHILASNVIAYLFSSQFVKYTSNPPKLNPLIIKCVGVIFIVASILMGIKQEF